MSGYDLTTRRRNENSYLRTLTVAVASASLTVWQSIINIGNFGKPTSRLPLEPDSVCGWHDRRRASPT
jgi:hypothetical protein